MSPAGLAAGQGQLTHSPWAWEKPLQRRGMGHKPKGIQPLGGHRAPRCITQEGARQEPDSITLLQAEQLSSKPRVSTNVACASLARQSPQRQHFHLNSISTILCSETPGLSQRPSCWGESLWSGTAGPFGASLSCSDFQKYLSHVYFKSLSSQLIAVASYRPL